MTGKLLCFV